MDPIDSNLNDLVFSLSELFAEANSQKYVQTFFTPMEGYNCLSVLSFEQSGESQKVKLRKGQRKFGVKRLTSFEKQNIENYRKNIESSHQKFSISGNTDELTEIVGHQNFFLLSLALQDMEQQLTQHLNQKYPCLARTCQKTEQLTYLLIELLQSNFGDSPINCLWLADCIVKYRQKNMKKIRRALNEFKLEEYLSKKCSKIFQSQKDNKAGHRSKYSSKLTRFLKEASTNIILCLQGVYEYQECHKDDGAP